MTERRVECAHILFSENGRLAGHQAVDLHVHVRRYVATVECSQVMAWCSSSVGMRSVRLIFHSSLRHQLLIAMLQQDSYYYYKGSHCPRRPINHLDLLFSRHFGQTFVSSDRSGIEIVCLNILIFRVHNYKVTPWTSSSFSFYPSYPEVKVFGAMICRIRGRVRFASVCILK